MARFFVQSEAITGDKITITGDEFIHLHRVLRLGAGDTITVCDGSGREYEATLRQILPEGAVAEIEATKMSAAEPFVNLTLVQGLPKAGKMDLIVQKGTEVGISRFLPVITERTVVNLNQKKMERRVERWRRIAREAAKQSRRAVVPAVDMPVTWADVLHRYRQVAGLGCLGVLPWEEECSTGLRNILQKEWAVPGTGEHGCNSGSRQDIWLFIGPEGGLSRAEVEQAREAGIISVTLGPRILRTETAGLIAAALVLYESGDLG